MSETDIDHNDTEAYNERATAYNFSRSPRGQLIIGQALVIAIKKLESVKPKILQETSNISDMRYLLDNLYTLYAQYHREEKDKVKTRFHIMF